MSPSDMDLVKLRAKCSAMELPLLKALCSETDLLTQQKQLQSKFGIRNGIANSTGNHPTRSNSNPTPPRTIPKKEPLGNPSSQQMPPARPPKPAKLRQQVTN